MNRPHLYFANCGHGPTRRWQDCLTLGFISAGQGDLEGSSPGYFGKQLSNLKPGDILAVYYNRKGYVGIGRVLTHRMSINDAELNSKKVIPSIFTGNMFRNSSNDYREYLVAVDWISDCIIDPEKQGGKCFGGHTPRNIIATLEKPNKKELRKCLEKEFKISFIDFRINP